MTTQYNQDNPYNPDNLPVAPQEQSDNLPQELTPLTDGEVAALNRYTDPGALIRRLYTYNWNPDMELEEVIRMAKQDESLGVKMRAITFLRKLVTDSMTQSGMIATLTQSSRDGNMSTTLSTKVVAGSLPYYEKIQQMKQVKQSEQEHTDQEETEQEHTEQENIQKGDTNVQTEQEQESTEHAERTESPEDATHPAAAPQEQSDNLETGLGDHKPPTTAGRSQYPGISVYGPGADPHPEADREE